MRVLIYEQFHQGHYYYYVHYLLPALLEITSDIVVAVTPQGYASQEFADLLAPFEGLVRFEASLPYGHDRIIKNEKVKLHKDLRHAVARSKPDYVLVPSGDPHTTAMGLFRVLGRGGLPDHRRGEVGIHHGLRPDRRGLQTFLRNRFDEVKIAAAGWSKVHIVNLLFFEHLQAHARWARRKTSLLPHPVKPNAKTKAESRQRLGLPEDGRILGVAGLIDYRKAVKEVLAAFRAASSGDERLLLAGPLTEEYRRHLKAEYSDLVGKGRIIALDRFLDADANQAALAAMDVVCTPYPGFVALSSVLLEGLAAGRPVLSNNVGWCEAIVNRCDAGWTCDVMSHDALRDAIRTAFDKCLEYRHTERTRRLLEFHAPENFAATFLRGVREVAGLAPSTNHIAWDGVLS